MDVYAALLVLWNALDQPRSVNQKLFQILQRDGLMLMLVRESCHVVF